MRIFILISIFLLGLNSGAAFSSNDPALILSWSFDETGGSNVADSSGNGLHGTSSGTWAPGKVNGALQLDGTKEQVVKVTLPLDKQFGKSSFSIACWIQPRTFDIDSKSKQRRIFGLEKWPDYFAVGDVFSDGRVNFSTGGRANSNATIVNISIYSKSAIPVKEWTHVVMVSDREAAKQRIYVNGVLSAEADLTKAFFENVVISGDRSFTVGSVWQSFAGQVDELKIWKKALTADAAKAVFEGK